MNAKQFKELTGELPIDVLGQDFENILAELTEDAFTCPMNNCGNPKRHDEAIRVEKEMMLKAKEKAEEEERAKKAKVEAEEAEQTKLEKRKKYQSFLTKNKYIDDENFYLKKEDTKIVLYKKIDEFIF